MTPSGSTPGSGLAAALDGIVGVGRSALGAAACSVAAITDDREHLMYLAAAGEGAAQVVGLRMPVTEGIAGFVAGAGQSITISDVQADARFARDTAESTGYVPTAMTVLPLQHAGETIGVLSVLDPTSDAAPGTLTELSRAAATIVDLMLASDDERLGRAGGEAVGTRSFARSARMLADQVAHDAELGMGERTLATSLLRTLATHFGDD